MKTEDLFEALQTVDDELLLRCEEDTKVHKRFTYRSWGVLAACAVIMLMAGVILWRNRGIDNLGSPSPKKQMSVTTHTATPAPTSNEVVQATLPSQMGDGMGNGALLAPTYGAIKNGNPWREDIKIAKLPIYKNNTYIDGAGNTVETLTEAQLVKLLKETAAILGETIRTDYVKKYHNVVESAECSTENTYITVDAEGCILVEFKTHITLPMGYQLQSYNVTEKKATKTTKYLLNQYKRLTKFTNPVVANMNDYTYDGKCSVTYSAYEGAEDTVQKIVNYNFHTVQFYPDENGRLWGIRLYNSLKGTKKLGDYPVISRKEAERLLLQGSYLTTEMENKPTKENICGVELTYYKGILAETVMPYYCFYIKLPDEDYYNGVHCYASFYVPAIESKYISDLPQWNGGTQ